MPHAPSPRLSSILGAVAASWRLRREGGDGAELRRAADLRDGDDVALCCGGYAASPPPRGVDLLSLVPRRCRDAVAVRLAGTAGDEDSTSEKRNKRKAASADTSSDVEDVTEEMHTRREERARRMREEAEEISGSDPDCSEQEAADTTRQRAPSSPSTAKRRRTRR